MTIGKLQSYEQDKTKVIATINRLGTVVDTYKMDAGGSITVPGSGGVMVAPTTGSANFYLNKPNGTSNLSNNVYGMTAGIGRWLIALGDGDNETGSNNGSDFSIIRAADNGAGIDFPLRIFRNTGQVVLNDHAAGYAAPGQLSGLAMNVNAGNADCLDVAPGGATSSDQNYALILPATWTKNITAAFAAGNGTTFGGLSSDSTFAANTWYHVHLIYNPTAVPPVADILFSTNATAPALPSGYTVSRRIGSVLTNASSQITTFTQLGDQFIWASVINNINAATLPAGNNNPISVSTPPGVKTIALFQAALYVPATGPYVVLRPLDQTSAIDPGEISLYGVAGLYMGGEFQVLTNTNSQIGLCTGGSGSNNYYVNTRGWIDSRGK